MSSVIDLVVAAVFLRGFWVSSKQLIQELKFYVAKGWNLDLDSPHSGSAFAGDIFFGTENPKRVPLSNAARVLWLLPGISLLSLTAVVVSILHLFNVIGGE